MSSAQNHHHGDLSEALVLAGVELLQESGMTGLTLRKCAARAGVSHAAPAHHFDGLNGLLAAITTRGFQLFADAMQAEIDSVPDDPHSVLSAACRGYLKFVDTSNSLFSLMFSPQMLEQENRQKQIESTAAYQILRDACAPFKHGKGGALTTEMTVWSLVHGFAQLSRQYSAVPDRFEAQNLQFDEILQNLNLEIA